MTNPNSETLLALAERLSDDAIKLAFGWFSFGSKAAVTSHPPHATIKANRTALDELLEAELITHEHERHERHRIDRHHYKGTRAIGELLATERAKVVLTAALVLANLPGVRRGSTDRAPSPRPGRRLARPRLKGTRP